MIKIMKMNFLLFLNVLIISCSSNSINDTKNSPTGTNNDTAKIVSVKTSGSENKYNFSVGISSPDKGCKQYANWWEVVTTDGELIYRRILAHSHVDEQPFTRSGGDVNIKEDQIVIVRVHMNNSSFSPLGFKGSVSGGFSEFRTEDSFAGELATMAPLPSGCAF